MSDDLMSVEMSQPMCIMRTKDIKHLCDRIEELEAERDALAEAIDSEHSQHGNIWRFWRGIADKAVANRKAAEAERDAMAEKLTQAEGALNICSWSWGECNRILEETEAKLSKCEALLAMALEALKHAKLNMPHPDQLIDDTIAELTGGKDE